MEGTIRDNADEQNTPALRRGRLIARTADNGF